ncbi:MAG TPA: class I SAM-dependent methyltransferase [Blastocatellia bacterium]|nr:class I SAM-dependent methyltransferase [Blastocatellia bacterium]
MTRYQQKGASDRWRKRFHAWLMAHGSPVLHRHYTGYKEALFSPLSGLVVEIGPGTGVNLAHYPKGVRWVGIEPNPYMVPYLRSKGEHLGLPLDIRVEQAPELSLPTGSADAVVTTLVLCTVADVEGTLQEIRRILKPGGRYVFIEHMAAPIGTRTRRLQDLVCPVWSFLADGCKPNRELWRALETAGFSSLDYTSFHVPIPIAGPHIAGVAIK